MPPLRRCRRPRDRQRWLQDPWQGGVSRPSCGGGGRWWQVLAMPPVPPPSAATPPTLGDAGGRGGGCGGRLCLPAVAAAEARRESCGVSS